MSLVRADGRRRSAKDRKVDNTEVKATEEKHPFEDSANAENAKRLSTKDYKGLLVAFGNTRGKGSIPIKWDKFDESKPETLPKSMQEFMDISGVKTESELVELVITGFNDAQYTAASDPIAEHVNAAWDKDTQNQFRLVVRNYSKATGSSIEETVSLMKPGVEAAFQKKQSK